MARIGNIQKLFGIRVQALRKGLKLTQFQLAEMADLSLKHLGEIERGRGNPTLETLQALAGAFHISLSELLEIEHEALSVQEIEQKTLKILTSASPHSKKVLYRVLIALER